MNDRYRQGRAALPCRAIMQRVRQAAPYLAGFLGFSGLAPGALRSWYRGERNGLHFHDLTNPAPRDAISSHAAFNCQSHQFGGGAHAELVAHDRGCVGNRLVGRMNQPRDLGETFT